MKFKQIKLNSIKLGIREQVAVLRVLRSGKLAQGKLVKKFESDFSNYVGSRYAVAVNSGTSALHLSVLALDIGVGDEVIVPSFTFAATANAVAATGATPIFADIDSETFTISLRDLDKLVTKNTKAIIAVHLFGQPALINELCAFAKKHNIFLIEDAAQAIGAIFENKKVGTFGEAGCFSFYATKNLTTGEGGMITTSNLALFEKLCLLRNQGMKIKYENEVVGFNNRMTEFQAAIGIIQLSKIDRLNKKRKRNADYYFKYLKYAGLPVVKNYSHVFHQFSILLPVNKREIFISAFHSNRIEVGIFYPTPVHKLPTYNIYKSLPVTEYVAKNILSIPIHPFLKKSELRKIVRIFNKTFGSIDD